MADINIKMSIKGKAAQMLREYCVEKGLDVEDFVEDAIIEKIDNEEIDSHMDIFNDKDATEDSAIGISVESEDYDAIKNNIRKH